MDEKSACVLITIKLFSKNKYTKNLANKTNGTKNALTEIEIRSEDFIVYGAHKIAVIANKCRNVLRFSSSINREKLTFAALSTIKNFFFTL